MLKDGVELLIDPPFCKRAERLMSALAAAAPPLTVVTSRYTGQRKVLVLYGVGLDSRYKAMRAHIKQGGHVAMWDLGYWDREEAMRVSIDHLHPTAAQMAMAPAGETRREVTLREDGDPKGPVLLIGMGPKSVHMYGLRQLEWERRMVGQIRKSHPGRQILWRPKGRKVTQILGTKLRHGMPIEEALKGCSLVVCRHSNCAIDAAIAGVPVLTMDGAARALYAEHPTPTREQRAEFLRQLGWWNWRPSEAPQAWDWMMHVTNVG